ncbi:hypothetical protein D3C76_1312820 [compost metagenome]
MTVRPLEAIRRPARFTAHLPPSVVNANQQADNIWLQADCILIPSGVQIRNPVAAHAPIDKGRLQMREIIAQLSTDDISVAMPQNMI